MYPSHECPFCAKKLYIVDCTKFCLNCKRGDLSDYTVVTTDKEFIFKFVIGNYYIVTSKYSNVTTIYNLISDAIIETIIVVPKFIEFDLNKDKFLSQINRYTMFS